jgi:hypothetical protein
MTNGSIILQEHKSEFSPIGTLNYEFYEDKRGLIDGLMTNQNVQCLVAEEQMPFGNAQYPALDDYADRVDTMLFLRTL